MPAGPERLDTAAIPIVDHQSGTFAISLVRDLPGSIAYLGDAHLSAYLSGHLTAG